MNNSEIELVLDIKCGKAEDSISLENNEEAKIEFGIKRGYLELILQNGNMHLEQRGLQSLPKTEWKVGAVGTLQFPIWTFESNDKERILEGHIKKRLGTVNRRGYPCIVTAVFKPGIFTKDFQITAQEGLWKENEEPQRITTKCNWVLKKLVIPQIKDYISKVEIQYE